MTSTREEVLEALHTALGSALPASAELSPRNDTLPARIPAGGVAILRDGDPGEPEVTLSPLAYHYQHRAEIDILVERQETDRDAAFDALARAIGTAIDADRTLGGRCDLIDGQAPAPLSLPIKGAETLKAATITLVLHYSAADPLL
ncbi:MAG: acyl-CoA transferase [Rhodobacteraceae bacterium]|nr:acyl-CoA transferase [Paracoccaceae bacterium]